MSDFASAVERAHRATAAIAQIEGQMEARPDDLGLRLNLLAMRRVVAQAEDYLARLSEEKHVDICKYRILPEKTNKFLMYYVSGSLKSYQDLFSQIYDFKRNNRKKANSGVSNDVFIESSMEFGYSFAGSLGIVLYAPSIRGFFEGNLDSSIDALFRVIEMQSPEEVREVAAEMGVSVVKKARDWSAVNIEAGYATDLRWSRSDGRQQGQVIGLDRMQRIVNMVDQASESSSETIPVEGQLVGGDITSGTFHFVVPHGEDFRGNLALTFDRSTEMLLGKSYFASIKQTKTLYYAAEKENVSNELLALR